MPAPFRTRFAPSPNGYLHAGHAYSALMVWDMARANRGTVHLRIDDIDQGRARPEFEAAIIDDLHWLGLSWPEPIRRQSEHLAAYQAALERLEAIGVTYPCFCTRKTVKVDVHGHYARTCRPLTAGEVGHHLASGRTPSIRLNIDAALAYLQDVPTFTDTGVQRRCDDSPLEDAVLARRDIGGSYILSCVVDDAAQGITHVVRGKDIQPMTATQVILQRLLRLPTPIYHHHDLITDDLKQKLSKSKGSQSLQDLRLAGLSVPELKEMLGVA